MAAHLSPDELHELANELRIEYRRLGGKPEWMPGSSTSVSSRLALIGNALERMRSGNYGVCRLCRSPIPYSRLMAIPETVACVECTLPG